MQGIGSGDRDVFPCDEEDVALAGIEGHLPVLNQFFKLLQVFLEDAGVSFREDLLGKVDVIGKQPHRELGVLIQVIDLFDE